MSWLTITLVVVFGSFLLAYGFTEWLARRERQRTPATAPAPRRRTDSVS